MMGVLSNFYENSRRYSKAKVNHRCQRRGSGDFLRCYWVAVYAYIIIFYSMFPLRCRRRCYNCFIASPELLLPAINYRRCCCYWGFINVCVVFTGESHGFDENSEQVCQRHRRLVIAGESTWTAIILLKSSIFFWWRVHFLLTHFCLSSKHPETFPLKNENFFWFKH